MSAPVEILAKKELKASVVMLRNDGIMEYSIRPNLTMNVSDARDIVDATNELGGGKKYPLLINAGNFSLVDTEVRYYASSPEANRFTIASAILVRNIAQKLMGNAYIKFNKPPTPTRLFTDEQEAVRWLLSYL
jgi:hypothetical protein